MSYLDKVLQPGEKILHRAKLSWTLYLPGILLLILALIAFGAISDLFRGQTIWALAALVVIGVPALYMILHAWFDRWITEIAVTNMRIILKRGYTAV